MPAKSSATAKKAKSPAKSQTTPITALHQGETLNAPWKYACLMRNKQGELKALQTLSLEAAKVLMPVFSVDEADDVIDADGRNQLVQDLSACWPHRCMLQIPNKPSDEKVWTELIVHLQDCKIPCVPSLGMKGPWSGLSDATTHRGAGLRITPGEIPAAGGFAASTLKSLGIPIEQIDVVIDCGYLQSLDFAGLIGKAIADAPILTKCRSLTLAGGSFPNGVSKITDKMSAGTVPRLEWQLFQQVAKAHPRLRFGDYLIDHPVAAEFIKGMQIPAAIRYTSDDVWHVVRGQNSKDNGSETMIRVYRYLVKQPYYSGSTFSYGDAEIYRHAGLPDGSKGGNATTWRTLGASHHLTFVAAQV